MTRSEEQAAGPRREPSAQRRGPRGGTTTITQRGWVKKNLWLPPGLSEQLREESFKQRTSEAELVRRGLERLFEGGTRELEADTGESDDSCAKT